MDHVFTDQMGRTLRLAKKPVRIISLVPSQTELLVTMGLENLIVGITKFCVHPKYLRKTKKVVGGSKKISFDKIRALKPDIVLCNKEENTQEMVQELEKEYPVHVSDIANIDGALAMIHQYGKIFNVDKKAVAIINKIKQEALAFKTFIADKPQKRVLYLIWRNPWMSIGKDTFIHHLLDSNNYVNVMEHTTRYPEITEEKLRTLSIDRVLLSSEPYPFKEKNKKEIQDILPKTEIVLVDGEYFSWYGSRLQDAFNYFKTLH